MRYEREFVVKQAARTDGLNRFVCVSLMMMESVRLAAEFFLNRAAGQPLPGGYIRFYLAALLIAVCFWVADRLSRGYQAWHYAVQFTGLTAGLVWAFLYAFFQVRRGHAGTPLPQILLMTSAGLRSPGPLHLGVNVVICLVYILLLAVGRLPIRMLGSEITNTMIYLFLSGVIIHATYYFQYESYRMERKNLELQTAQLDGMSEQLEQTRQMAKEVLAIRHDMRHYVWEVREALERGDYGAAGEVTKNLAKRLGQANPGAGVRDFTGEPSCDAILTKFAAWADEKGIPFQVELELPRRMAAQDMCLILMNALENAARAVAALPEDGPRLIRVLSSTVHGQYFFEMTNSCCPGSVVFREGEQLPSAREKGHGYGTRSIASVLERSGAVYRFQVENGQFYFRFLLPEDEIGEPRR